jgi:hypothetical protein
VAFGEIFLNASRTIFSASSAAVACMLTTASRIAEIQRLNMFTSGMNVWIAGQ